MMPIDAAEFGIAHYAVRLQPVIDRYALETRPEGNTSNLAHIAGIDYFYSHDLQ